MTQARRSRRRRRGRGPAPRSRRRTSPFFRAVAILLLAGSFVGGFVAARHLVALDRVVRARFEGRLFRVPSRVLAAPTILYPGLDWKRIDLPGTLRRLGYRESGKTSDLPLGSFHWGEREVRLHRRAFDHPSRPEPARELRIVLRGSRLEELRDAASGRELGAVLLEPEQVGSYYGPDHEQRDLVRVGEVPQHLIDAILAVEDQRFLEHPGLDLRRIAGAFWVNLRSGEIRQGGSTLTQQLVKNFFLTPERSFRRKAQEALMALLVEAHYDKQAILESYLNEIYLGQRGSTAVHGVGEASRLHFGKRVRELSVAEAATLAAIIQSPNGLSPHRRPEEAERRRDLVLGLMREQGRIDETTWERAVEEPLRVAAVTPEPREARWFLDALRRQLPEYYGVEALATEGLEIYSTLDMRLQRIAARVVREELSRLEKDFPKLVQEDDGPRVQACLLALRPQTGEVVALVGGRDYARSQFDRCTQARRPAGSVFKPFVYVAALESDASGPEVTLASFLDDTPLEVATPSGPWAPENYDHEFHGEVPLRQALERSFNVATARLGQRVGIAEVAEMAHRLGITSPLPEVPSLAIGAADLSPLELARAYATLANGGIRPEIRTFEDVVDPEEGTIARQPIRFERVLDPGTAYLAVSLLEGVVDRGTARAVRAAGIQGPVAGKTGTSDEERDAWFVGFTPELVVAVWVGFDTPQSLGIPSSRAAVPLWIRFLKEATGGRIRGLFARPQSVARLEIDPASGAVALAGCPRRRVEYFLPGTEPTATCPTWAGRPARREARERPGGVSGLIQRLFERWLEDL